jgi:hypothetical protein
VAATIRRLRNCWQRNRRNAVRPDIRCAGATGIGQVGPPDGVVGAWLLSIAEVATRRRPPAELTVAVAVAVAGGRRAKPGEYPFVVVGSHGYGRGDGGWSRNVRARHVSRPAFVGGCSPRSSRGWRLCAPHNSRIHRTASWQRTRAGPGGLVTPSARRLDGGRTTRPFVSVDDRPRVNAATRFAKVALAQASEVFGRVPALCVGGGRYGRSLSCRVGRGVRGSARFGTRPSSAADGVRRRGAVVRAS